MPRKQSEKENVIDELIQKYYHIKEDEKEVKQVVDELNAEIKSYFKEKRLDKYETNGYKASVTKVIKKKYIDKLLIPRLKSLGFSEAIDKVEVINNDVLESLLYNNKLKIEDIEDCQNIEEIISLRVTKK